MNNSSTYPVVNPSLVSLLQHNQMVSQSNNDESDINNPYIHQSSRIPSLVDGKTIASVGLEVLGAVYRANLISSSVSRSSRLYKLLVFLEFYENLINDLINQKILLIKNYNDIDLIERTSGLTTLLLNAREDHCYVMRLITKHLAFDRMLENHYAVSASDLHSSNIRKNIS